MRRVYRVVAAHRDYRLLLAAGLVSMAGDWTMRVGLSYAVYALTGSTLAAAATLLASLLPQLVCASLAGGLAAAAVGHRFRPRHLLGYGALAFGALDLLLLLYPLAVDAWWPPMLVMAAAGLPGALLLAGLLTLFQAHTDDAHRGRVLGAAKCLGGRRHADRRPHRRPPRRAPRRRRRARHPRLGLPPGRRPDAPAAPGRASRSTRWPGRTSVAHPAPG